MRVLWATQPIPETCNNSIFLAGPTPRSDTVRSWRPDALHILSSELNFEGQVFVPETEDGSWKHDYMDQVEWEDEALVRSTVIAFWVPRDLKTMPAFTTNIEWGVWHRSGKVVLGAPIIAPKMKYLWHYANKYDVPIGYTLRDTLIEAVQLVERLSN